MADLQVYLERTAGKSPTKCGVSRRGGAKSRYTLLIGDDGQRDGDGQPLYPAIENPRQVHNAIKDILGTTYTHPDGLRLRRTMPKADPFSPWLFADDIAEYGGRGVPVQTESPSISNMETAALEYYAQYPCYEFDVSFTPRPYAHVADEDIPTSDDLPWFDETGTGQPGSYAAEWLRYTDVLASPTAEWLTAQAGQFVIDVASGFKPDGVQSAHGQLRMLVAQNMLKTTWYEVPYPYIETGSSAIVSNVLKGLGHVNQFEWRGYPAGSLLLEAVGVERYTAPIPKSRPWEGLTETYAFDKLCDITFVFLHVNRNIGPDAGVNIFGVPVVAPATATPRAPTNRNTIQAHWNLVPYAHMGNSWYFARTQIALFPDANDRPLFPSLPFEFLFTNPGVTT